MQKEIQKQEALQVKQNESLKSYLKRISDRTGISIDFVNFVSVELNKTMRNIPDLDLWAKLAVLIPEIAKDNGAKIDAEGNYLTDKVLEKSIKIIRTKFKFLSIAEIEEAYNLWASGKFTALEMYSGTFNVKHFGSVMTAYSKYRLPIVQLIERYQDYLNKMSDAKKRREKFENEFKDIVLEERKRIEVWQQVPEFWYRALRSRNMIEFTKEEANSIYQEALKLVDIEKKRLAITETKRTIEVLLQSPKSPEAIRKHYESEAQMIARKLIVFRKVVENKSWL